MITPGMLYGFKNNGRGLMDDYADWLYEDNYTKEKFSKVALASILPGIGQYTQYLLDMRNAEEYLARNQMTWSDIHDPRKLTGFGSTAASYRAGLNFVSSNVKRLYD